MRICNTCEKIKTTFANGFDISVWRKYAEEISNELPSKCENDAKSYDFNKDVLPVIEDALNEEKINFVSRNFQTVIDTLNVNLSNLFDKEPDINIILYLGLCNGAGWATTLDGKNTVLLGIEKIIELAWGDETNMRALIFHEIGHLWHKLNGNLHISEFSKRRKGIAQLYCEGVAMVCEHLLCGDNEFYHQNKDGWLSWCYKNENEIKREYLRRLDKKESIQDFFGDWCSYNGHSDVGYFLGCRFIEHLMKTYSLKKIANMKYRILNKEYKKFTEHVVLYNNLQFSLPEFIIEQVTLENLIKYENIFYSNEEYYMITDGHPATKQDCVDTIEYAKKYPLEMCYCLGVSNEQQPVAFLSLLEGYPESTTLYVGLLLIDKRFQRNSIGTRIMNAVIDDAFSSGYATIKLSVQDNNVSGYSFWKKLGFKAVKKTSCDGFYNLSMELKSDN
ncbi:MAG: GNAT family N-acetyltransferase [Ruminococcaceae bacterium]|nr:GNAT family N-acetyltransferase [Oscillospiraceae bacterium]